MIQSAYKQTLLEESSYFVEELLSLRNADEQGSFLLNQIQSENADNYSPVQKNKAGDDQASENAV